jgi:hypothetical protein
MTDEERQRLLAEMRYYMAHGQLPDLIAVCDKAANEIERLTITPLGVEAAAHAIRLVSGRSLEECHILAHAALCGAFP